MQKFTLDKEAIKNHERVELIEDLVPIDEHLNDLERFINECFVRNNYQPTQHGRVIAVRATDQDRLSSAFKSALYLGKYQDMANVQRFLKKMVKQRHSYEPIRGENILFLFIGVGKPVYDHLVTYSTGRSTRIAGGQRANLPWGYEIPVEAKDPQAYVDRNMPTIKRVLDMVGGSLEDTPKEQIQAARSELPVGYIMPPFLMEFSEEALIKNVFQQRLFEKGAQGATVDVVNDMWQCATAIDEEKWSTLYDYHGPHTQGWERAMRTIRDKNMSLADLIDLGEEKGVLDLSTEEFNMKDINLYDLVMKTVGKAPKSMWEKDNV